MIFNSLSYFMFLPIVFLVFILVGDRYRWLVLLISSYIFYGFIFKPILLIALSTVILVTYWLGKLINRSTVPFVRSRFLFIGIVINLALLVYFKYIPFLVSNLNTLLTSSGIDVVLDKPLPLVSIGLSFFIFQAISYLADIYFLMAEPEEHFGYFALYIAFFPKLLQGPIERAGDLIPQLKAKFKLNYDNVRFGILLFSWGCFKKVVIADRLGTYVDVVYNDVHAFTGLPLLLATYSYAFQIYLDFSGYTDMALGSALLFNINLTQNFNSPFLATSCTDYWRRWHISLSKWILDYVFEPLQMKFRNFGKSGTAVSLLVTFIVCGIWHGASWSYIVWGFIHGIYLAVSTYYRPYQKKLHKRLGLQKTAFLRIWQTVITFQLICFSFIFFRAANINDAIYLAKNTIVGMPNDFSQILGAAKPIVQIMFPGQSQGGVIFTLCLVVSTFIFSFISSQQKQNISQYGGFAWLPALPLPVRYSLYAVLFYLFAFNASSTQSFIYMQF